MPPAFQSDPTKEGYYVGPDASVPALMSALGFIPKQVDPNAPGSSIDTSQSEEDKQRMQALIAQLQQQAATGNGSWQQALQTATENAQGAASAVGQSEEMQAKTGVAGAMRNTANAQGAAAQRAVGEGNILRAESQQGAQNQLATLEGEQGSQDVNQANAVAQANQGVSDLNAALQQQAKQNWTGTINTVASMFSSGGRVPGHPIVMGNDEKNDTVPAMLSPGEIVVPRTKARDPKAAAEFAAAIARRHGKHLAGGGTSGGTGISDGPGLTTGQALESVFLPHVGAADYFGSMGGPQAPSIQNGGLLDTSGADATRAGALGNTDLLAQRAAGQGPSAAPQEAQNASDASIANALRAGKRVPAASATQAAAEQGGGAAKTALEEQQGGTKALASALLAQRQNDLALAEAKQQAAFRRTELNAGLTIANQAQLRGIIAGAGQAATAYLGAQSGDPAADPNATPENVANAAISAGVNPETDPDIGQAAQDAGTNPEGIWSGGAIPNLADGGRVVTDSGLGSNELTRLRAEYDAGQAKKAIEKGPDLAYRISEAGKAAAQLARKAAGSVSGMAEGGGVYSGYDPETGGAKEDPFARFRPALEATGKYAEAVKKRDEEVGARARAAEESIKPHPQGALQNIANAVFHPLDTIQSAITTPEGDLKPGVKAAGQIVGNAVAPQLVDAPKEETPPIAAPARKPPAVAPKAPSLAAGFESAGVNPEAPAEAPVSPQEQIGEAQSEEARSQKSALLQQEESIAAHQRELRQDAEKAAARGEEVITAGRRIAEEMAKADSGIDPGRFWATRTTGQKITGIIGLALGSLGAGPDGVNRAAGMLNEAINRDIDAQKAEHTIRLQRGKQALEGYQSLYGQMRQLTDDEASAKKLAYAAGQDLVKTKFERFAATAKDPIAKQQAILGAQKAAQEAEAARSEAKLKNSEANFNDMRAARLAGAGGAPAGGLQALQRFKQAWQKGGGLTGKVTQYIPGTSANDVADISPADATAIATQLNGNKAPRPALIEKVQKELLPKPGQTVEDGMRKIRELELLLSQNRAAPGGAEDVEE